MLCCDSNGRELQNGANTEEVVLRTMGKTVILSDASELLVKSCLKPARLLSFKTIGVSVVTGKDHN